MNRTPYTETEFLLAVMENDTEEMDRLVTNMLPGEITRLRRQLEQAQLELRIRA